MGIIGIAMSLLFRLQLAWPDHQFTIYEIFLGKWGENGVMDPNVYLGYGLLKKLKILWCKSCLFFT